MKKLNVSLFLAISLCFSAVLLVCALLGCVEQAELGAQISAIEDRIQALEKENRILEVRLINQLSLEELERCAAGRLGMRTPSAGQIIYIDMGQAG